MCWRTNMAIQQRGDGGIMAGCEKCKGHIGNSEGIVHWHCYRDVVKLLEQATEQIRLFEATILKMATDSAKRDLQ
jgi:hypothetical protein